MVHATDVRVYHNIIIVQPQPPPPHAPDAAAQFDQLFPLLLIVPHEKLTTPHTSIISIPPQLHQAPPTHHQSAHWFHDQPHAPFCHFVGDAHIVNINVFAAHHAADPIIPPNQKLEDTTSI